MPGKVYRTAIYTRLSRDDGDKAESDSIVSQKALCEDYIQNHAGLRLVKIYADDGWSGVDLDRPDFRLLEQDIRDGKIDCIVCKDLSRFSRNYIEAGRYLERIFPQLGVRFIAINDGYDSAAGNRQSDSIIIPFKNLINDTYCKDISVKIRSSLEVKRRRGEYVGAFAPFGYAKAPDDKRRLVVDDYAGEIVRTIFGLYKEGVSIGAIADRLNETGVPSPMEYRLSQGSRYQSLFKTHDRALWSYPAIHRILTNEVYLGVLVQGKTGTPNYKVKKLRPKEGSEWVRVEDSHEPLITHADFVAVKTMLERDRRALSDKGSTGLFSGFLFCGDCGQSMVRKTVPAKNRKYIYYICSSYKRGECSQHSISEKELERIVLHALQDQIGLALDLDRTLAYIDRLPSASRKICGFDAQIAYMEEEIEKAKRLFLRLYEDLADGIISKNEYREFREHYRESIRQKQETLGRLQRERRDAAGSGVTERGWVSLFREHENLERLDRRALMALVDKIIIHKNHVVEVCFKYRDECRRAQNTVSLYRQELQEAI